MGLSQQRPVRRGPERRGWQDTQPSGEVGPGRKVLEGLTGEFRAGRKEALQFLSHRMTA